MSTEKTNRFSLANLAKSFHNGTFKQQQQQQQRQEQQQKQQQEQDVVKKWPANRRRLEKTQSLFIKPPPAPPSSSPRPSFHEDLPKKSHTQHIKKTIRRSLSVIMYANPASRQDEHKHLVPVLVTPNVIDPMMLMEDKRLNVREGAIDSTSMATKVASIGNKKPKPVMEYDNTMIIEPMKSSEKKEFLILWQGYGYTLQEKNDDHDDDNSKDKVVAMTVRIPRMEAFDQEQWSTYQGLIHPLHLFDLGDEYWQHLSVNELRRYYDNYGSMMLKQREWRQQQQTLQYLQHTSPIMV